MSAFDEEVARPTAQYPAAQITPAEFEEFTTSLFTALEYQRPVMVVELG